MNDAENRKFLEEDVKYYRGWQNFLIRMYFYLQKGSKWSSIAASSGKLLLAYVQCLLINSVGTNLIKDAVRRPR